MSEWWDEYEPKRDPQQDAATAANAAAAQEIGPVDYGYTPPQEIGPVDYGFTPDASPAAVADALDNRGFVGNAIKDFFGGIGNSVGGYLDKKFGTQAEYDAQQADLQRRLASPDDPAAMYTEHKPRGFNLFDAATVAAGGFPLGGALGMVPTALQMMGYDVQDMTPYGLAVMQRDDARAAAERESFGHMPEGSPSYEEYSPGADQEAGIVAPPKPMPGGYAPGGMGGSSKPVKFSGYPDFTKANPYG